jgi:single-strand DNA-binding protein
VSSGLNRVMLLGDLAADPEVYVTRSGKVVLGLKLGTPEPYLDKDEVARERVSYHYVVVIGQRADTLSKVLRRGARVFVDGSLRSTSYEGRDGKKRTKTEVVAAEVLFAGPTASGMPEAEPPRPPAPINASLPFR